MNIIKMEGQSQSKRPPLTISSFVEMRDKYPGPEHRNRRHTRKVCLVASVCCLLICGFVLAVTVWASSLNRLGLPPKGHKSAPLLFEQALKKHLAASVPNGERPDGIFGTQISSPDNTAQAQATTHQNQIDRKQVARPGDQDYQEYYKGASEEEYGPEEFFYSENDAQDYYYNYEENSWGAFILEKIQQLHAWLTSDMEGPDSQEPSRGDKDAPIPQVLEALNYSIISGDATVVLSRLKNMYYKHNNHSANSNQTLMDLTHSSSVMSLGLLALDILLLRSIQLMAWDDQETANNAVMKDPEVFAMNAMFMEPEKVRIFYEKLKQTHLRSWSEDPPEYESLIEEESLTSGFYSNTNILKDLLEFAVSSTRAAIYLGKAYRIARARENEDAGQTSKMLTLPSRSEMDVSELDCIWTVYCRNLERTAMMSGPYGFLAKVSSIGLRLLTGNVALERAMEALLEETLTSPRGLRCDKLFPRCSSLNAAKVVLESIIGKG